MFLEAQQGMRASPCVLIPGFLRRHVEESSARSKECFCNTFRYQSDRPNGLISATPLSAVACALEAWNQNTRSWNVFLGAPAGKTFGNPRKPKSWRISAILKSSHGYVLEDWREDTKRYVSSNHGCIGYRISSETSAAAKSDHLWARKSLNVVL
ncbi:uncharacterized protein CC84DRAFT_385041 [Paraphaeosphaeria sporulosa]|uniref:Uncharacterized protein n=1 Tax=Paraphaeosphaeria sporulosa TaxID=1460663 RepID=A0A177BVM4_9PLEO|nr:uncharacterized protein CC84DRAFT_385041 [Paraphaeosphaeria sporulosa]OAF99205.1 hypothetical protein CC84DRAFT_385041 [Paraphaeosphaeria sporulosa]